MSAAVRADDESAVGEVKSRKGEQREVANRFRCILSVLRDDACRKSGLSTSPRSYSRSVFLLNETLTGGSAERTLGNFVQPVVL
jgi:hypothetical protein